MEYLGGLVALVLLMAALMLAWSGFRTAEGRFSGSTENSNSLFAAATVDLTLTTADTGKRVEFLFANDDLYPGFSLQRCVRVTHIGSLSDPRIQLYGRQTGGSGLEQYLTVDFELGSGGDPDCRDFQPRSRLFSGTLAMLSAGHDSFETGLELGLVAEGDGDGDFGATLRATAGLLDDNRAQGLNTEFWVVIEART